MPTPPRRGWPRYSLRTLFVVVAVIAGSIPIAQMLGPIGSALAVGLLLVIAGMAFAVKSRWQQGPRSETQAFGWLMAIYGVTLIMIAGMSAFALMDD